MARVIFKYELAIKDVQSIEMPDNASILSAQNQDGKLMVWALCVLPNFKHFRKFYLFGTCTQIDLPLRDVRFINTVQLKDYVWHVFEEI